MALAQRRSSTESASEQLLGRISFASKDDRRRVGKALKMFSQMMKQRFHDRVDLVVADYESYNPDERTMSLDVQADLVDDEHAFSLEDELADEVLGPIFGDTRVILPVRLARTVERPTDGVGIIFPLEH